MSLAIPATVTALAAAALLAAAAIGWLKRAQHSRPRIDIVYGDITAQRVDVIVNAAKRSLLGGGGVDGAIHKAGGADILRQCKLLRSGEYPDGLPTGSAVATGAGDLSALWVIHTVGPVYDQHQEYDKAAELRSCYTESLLVADELGASTIAFPLISSGVYGWPVGDAVRQALAAIAGAKTHVKIVRLVLFDRHAYDIAVAAVSLLGKR